MEPFINHTGLVMPLDRVDVDTDQIIPKQYMKWITRTGYEVGLFHDWRYRADGSPNPDFVLNFPQYQGASILVTGRNFGCGSSREHAPWALQQYGFRVVLAPSFADIFRNNCHQIGLLPVVLPEEKIRELIQRATNERLELTVDLENQLISDGRDAIAQFDIDPFVKYRLLNGLDDIGLTLQREPAIGAYEAKRPSFLPRTTA